MVAELVPDPLRTTPLRIPVDRRRPDRRNKPSGSPRLAFEPVVVYNNSRRFPARDQLPQHGHWDWEYKVPRLDLLAYRGIGVDCAGEMQGLMLIATAGHAARLAPQMGRP